MKFPYLYALVTSLLFSGSYIAGKYTTLELDPLTTTFLRYVIALVFLCLLIPLHKRESMKIERRDLVKMLALGLTGIVGYHYFFFLSLHHTAVANTAIINALSPVFTAMAAAVFVGERVSGRNYFGVCLAVAGVLALLTGVTPSKLLSLTLNRGDLFMLAAVLCFMVYALLIKTLVERYSGYVLTLYATAFGVIWLVLISPLEHIPATLSTLSHTSIKAVIYMGVAGSGLGYLTFNLSIKALGATRTSTVVYSVIPIAVAVAAYFIFAEPITLAMLLSTVLVLVGLKFLLGDKQ